MQRVGTVKQLQIQRYCLKVGEVPNRRYDPAPIEPVDALLVGETGCFGIMADGSQIVDVHNALHHGTRHRVRNGLSVGFTTHYDAMRDTFGGHLTDGIAGENIIVETTQDYSLSDLGERIGFKNPADGVMISFIVVDVVAPCVEFSQFCGLNQFDAAQIKDALIFLGEGKRGFLIEAESLETPPIIRAGYEMHILQPAFRMTQ